MRIMKMQVMDPRILRTILSLQKCVSMKFENNSFVAERCENVIYPLIELMKNREKCMKSEYISVDS
jgi:hypothetical protein